jgi:hypothetical protein
VDPARSRLDRYLAVVEAWGLCPWAEPARRAGELEIAVIRGAEITAQVDARTAGWLAAPGFRIGLLVLPDAGLDPVALRRVRDRLAATRPALAVADFHPDGGDPARADTPARLVPLLRRSPDPMLQLVPTAALAQLAAAPPVASPGAQAAMLAGIAAAPAADPRARIADANAATVAARGLDRLLAELAALRAG